MGVNGRAKGITRDIEYHDWEKMEDGSPTWKLDYIRIIPPLVATVKSQAKRIEELEDNVSRLEKLVESIMKS